MTHKELVKIAPKIAKKFGFPLAITEMKTANKTGEIPDCLAFKGGGTSLLIECKTSREDFLRDRTKEFRRYYCTVEDLQKLDDKQKGMGDFRVYLFSKDVNFASCEIPFNWVYVVVDEKGKILRSTIPVTNCAFSFAMHFDKNAQAELAFLYSYIRRNHEHS